MQSRQAGSALIIATMALLAVGLAAVAVLRLEGQSLTLDHVRRDGVEAASLRTAVELYAVRHHRLPPPGALSWRDLGVAPDEVAGYSLEGDCGGWSLHKANLAWRFPPADGCQAAGAGG